jgi:3-hydroxybutyryl-CoA dehydrogenase
MGIKKVGVIGTGVMGHGIAQLCAMTGYETKMYGRSDESLNRAITNITKSLDGYYVAKGKMTETERDAALGRITPTKDLEALSESDVVIESIIEDMRTKIELFARLDHICPAVKVAATDTAGLSVTKIAEATKTPQRVVGIHLLSPVVQSRALELIRPSCCSEEVCRLSSEFCESFGKEVVLANDTPGFIINRLLTPFVLDAVRLWESGVASKEDIDRMMRTGAGHSVGPIQLLDLAGLDNYCNLADNLYEALGDEKLRVPRSMRKLVEEGHFGRKTGKGFYDWSKK